MAGSWQMDNCCNCEGTTNSCSPTDASYAVVTGIQPAVTSDNTVDLGTQPAGNYILKYCAGAWNDGVDSPGWMAWGYGQNVLIWTVAYAYHLVFVAIGGYPYITGNTAPDTSAATPPSGGWTSAAAAQAATFGAWTHGEHSGGDMGVRFAQFGTPGGGTTYGTNTPASSPIGAPTFTLYKLKAGAIKPVSVWAADLGSGQYICSLTVTNTTGVPWLFGATLVANSNFTILSSSTLGDQLIQPNSTLGLNFTIQLTGSNHAFTADLEILDAAGTVDTFTFDFTPTITSFTATGIGTDHDCSTNIQRINANLATTTGLPFSDLKYSIDLTGGVTSVLDYLSCLALSMPADLGDVGGGNDPFSFSMDISASGGTPASVTMTFRFTDPAVSSIPPWILTVPCTWS